MNDTTKNQNLDDFGEVIHGAKKHNFADLDLTNADTKKLPLSKLWPKSEIDAIEDAMVAAVAHHIRNSLPTKPRKPSAQSRWFDKLEQAQTTVAWLIERPENAKVLVEKLEAGGWNNRAGAFSILMLAQIDRKHWDKMAFDIRGNNFIVSIGDENHRYGVADASTANIADVADAMKPAVEEALANLQAAPPKQKAVQFGVYRNTSTSEIFIAVQSDKHKTPLIHFDSVEEARNYLRNEDEDIRRENVENLNQLWQEHKELNNIAKADMRSAENTARIGMGYRDGRDITPEEFLQTFNVRGGQFGNWVKGDERQIHLNHAYDAFMDLSKAANIPPSAIGLNGELGIAFGARGSGWAAAHYETQHKVINLTKTKGAGSLAHEWWHALDHYLGDKNLATRDITTIRPENMRHTELSTPLQALLKATSTTGLQQRSIKADGYRSKPYFGTHVEMTARAFEKYVANKLEGHGIRNDYLVNIINFDDWQRSSDAYVYPKDDELEAFSQAYDHVFDKLSEVDKSFQREAKAVEQAAEAAVFDLKNRQKAADLDSRLFKTYINEMLSPSNYHQYELYPAVFTELLDEAKAFTGQFPNEPQLTVINKKIQNYETAVADFNKFKYEQLNPMPVEQTAFAKFNQIAEKYGCAIDGYGRIFDNHGKLSDWKVAIEDNDFSFVRSYNNHSGAKYPIVDFEKRFKSNAISKDLTNQTEQVTEPVQTTDQPPEFGQSADMEAPSANEKELPPQHPVEIPADDKGSKLGSSKSDEYLQKIADRILEQVKNNEAPWQMPFEAGTIHNVLPVSGASGKTYQGLNLINLMATAAAKGYDDNRWFTYNNALEAGGQVRRGEKGTQIHFWQHPTDEDIEKEKAKAAAEGREPKRLSPMLRIYTVFNANQIDGLPERQLNEKLLADFERHEKAESILENSGVRIEHTPEKTGYYSAHYNPRTDTITLPQRELFVSADAYYATALHELAHATGHESRLNRDLSGAFGSYSYAKEELRAEMASMMIGQELQLGHDPSNHYAYLQSWAAVIENDPKEFFKAVKDADLITNYVLNLDKTKEKVAEVEQKQDAEQAAVVEQALSKSALEKAVDSVVAGNTPHHYVHIGTTPDVLKMLGVPEATVSIKGKTIEKVMGYHLGIEQGEHSHLHNLTPESLKNLPEQINNPIAVFKSSPNSTNPKALIVLTELKEKNIATGRESPVIVAMKMNYDGKFLDISSIYGKDSLKSLQRSLDDSLLYWNKEKGQKLIDTIGLQLPKALHENSDLSYNVKTNEDLSQYISSKNVEIDSPKMALPADIPHSVHEVAKLDKPLEDKVLMLAEQSAIADKIQSVDNVQLKSFVRGIKTAMDFNEHNYKQLLDLATYSNKKFDAREFALHTGMVGDQGVVAYDKALQDLADAGILKSIDDGWKYELTDEAAYLIKQTYNVVEAEKATQQEIPASITKPEPVAEAVQTTDQASEFGQQHSDFEKELQSINLPEGVNYSYERLNEDVEIARLYVGEWRDDKLIGEQAFIDKNAKFTGYVAKYGENEAQIYNNLQFAVDVVGNQLAKDYAADIAEYKRQQAIQAAPPAPQGNITAENRRLFVPYEQKDVASALGARWDKDNKTWYAPAGSDLDKFKPWLKEPVREFARPEDEFARQLEAHGLRLEAGHPIMDGRWHRLKVEGDRTGSKSGAYIGHLDGVPRGTVKNYKTSQETNWTAKDSAVKSVPSSLDIERAKAAAEAKQKASYNQAADAAKLVLNHAQPAQNHPYLDKKGVSAHGVYVVPDKSAVNLDNTNLAIANDWREAKAMRENFKANGVEKQVLTKGDLIVPAINEHGDLRTFQTISGNDGSFKSFVKGGEKSGSFHVIGDLDNAKDVMIAEGYATAASLHEETGKTVIVAFDAGNLTPVAEKVRALAPQSNIYIAADNDHTKANNAGINAANKAAEKVGAVVIAPNFDAEDKGTDWNDLQQSNRDVFRMQLQTSEMGRRDFENKLANLPPEKQEVFKGWYDYVNEKLSHLPETRNNKQASLEQEILKAEQGLSNLPSVAEYQAAQAAKKQQQQVQQVQTVSVTPQIPQPQNIDAGKGKGGSDWDK